MPTRYQMLFELRGETHLEKQNVGMWRASAEALPLAALTG